MSRTLNDVIRIMRLAIGRRNENDPDSTDAVLTQYINDVRRTEMGSDVHLFEVADTLIFDVDASVTDGVYTWNDVGASTDFINVRPTGHIAQTDQGDEATSWQEIDVCQDPLTFYNRWGIRNTDILTAGFPTQLLYYGNEIVVRTIPDQSYTIHLYGYKLLEDFSSTGNPDIEHDWWLRYLAYAAARAYSVDYMVSPQKMEIIRQEYRRQKKNMLERTHNQIKYERTAPRF